MRYFIFLLVGATIFSLLSFNYAFADTPFTISKRTQYQEEAGDVNIYEIQSKVDSIDILGCSYNKGRKPCINLFFTYPKEFKFGDKSPIHALGTEQDDTLEITIDTDQGEYSYIIE